MMLVDSITDDKVPNIPVDGSNGLHRRAVKQAHTNQHSIG